MNVLSICRWCPPFLCALLSYSTAWSQCGEKLVEGSSIREQFGRAVAIDGNTALIGAPSNDLVGDEAGAVFLYVREGVDWRLDTVLTSSKRPAAGESFGYSVDVQGNLAIVGAPAASPNLAGAVYIFERSGQTWTELTRLTPFDGDIGDRFGESVSLSRNLAIVGSPFHDASGRDSGAVYVYRDNTSSWDFETKLTASDGDSFDRFGLSVDSENDVVLVGAPTHSLPQTAAGAAYVYRVTRPALWTEEAKLIASQPRPLEGLGRRVSIHRDVAVLGGSFAQRDRSYYGAAYVFRRSQTGWDSGQELRPTTLSQQDAFASAVDVQDDWIAVGSRSEAGSVILFEWQDSTWVQTSKNQGFDQGDDYAFSLALDDGWLLVGAPSDDEIAQDAGAAWIWPRDTLSLVEEYGMGWPGTLRIPSIELSRTPVLGSQALLRVSNSRVEESIALVLVGLRSDQTLTNLGGTLLVQPDWTTPLNLPSAGKDLPFSLPCRPAWLGLNLHLQSLVLDPGASQGVAFSPGLRVVLGSY